MQAVDYVILITYLCVLILLGLYFRRKANQSMNDYFLGGRSIPWWVLATSGMSGNLDLAGTMIIVSFFYILGVKGFLIEIRGGVVLALAFFMVLMSKWHTRSKVVTVAEWMEYRFGSGKPGQAARLLSAIASVIFTIGMVAYFSVAAGKFLSEFLPFSDKVCALLLIAVALFYTAISGLYGVAYIDVFQAALIVFGIVFMSVKAYMHIDLTTLQALTSKDWTSIIPKWTMDMPKGYEIYHLFGLTVMFYFIRIGVEGFGGPQSYMAQRFFAAKTERESGMLGALWTILLAFRWPFVMAIAILGLTLGSQITDPEMVMPAVLTAFAPAGIKGLLIASLLAAALSTFDSTLNAGAAYLVNDIYYRYINPKASQKTLVRVSILSTVLIVVLGVFIGMITPSINSIWGWITMSLGAGLILPLMMRWYWWRFNGYSFAFGTGVGIIAAVVQKAVAPHAPEWLSFLVISLISLFTMLVVTLLTKPAPMEVLKHFYETTRPFGFWGRVRAQVDPEIVRSIKKEGSRDIIAICFAVPWQLSLFLIPTHVIMHHWAGVAYMSLIFVVSSIGLYFFWFRRLNAQTVS